MSHTKISKAHTNRKLNNWLLYDIGDKYLIEFSSYYKGILFDLGCGEAPFKEFFLQYVEKYIGIDWSDSLHNTKADIVANLNETLPVDDEIADTIVSISVLEHLYEPQIMINEAFRILKPQGIMLLQVPWQWWIHEAPHDYFRFTPYALEYMFKKAGFLKLEIIPQCGFFTTWIMKFNYFSSRFIRGHYLTRLLIKTILIPIWYTGQKIAPYLDKLDRNWALESQGYYVLAKKR